MRATREEIEERLPELKRSGLPHASMARLGLAMEDPETWAALAEMPAVVAVVERYLHGYCAPAVADDGRVTGLCPFCGAWGRFSWGLVHGAGECACGWPGRLYHFIRDVRDDPDVVCVRTVNGQPRCGLPRGEHVRVADGELRCPDPQGDAFPDFTPPDIARLTLLLWVHPHDVHLARRRATASA